MSSEDGGIVRARRRGALIPLGPCKNGQSVILAKVGSHKTSLDSREIGNDGCGSKLAGVRGWLTPAHLDPARRQRPDGAHRHKP